MLRIGYLVVVWMAASGVVLAQGHARAHQDEIDAAINQAVARLQLQVERMPLSDQLTVGELLDRTGGREELTQTLRRAEMVGGPRWIDKSTCEVRLEISGQRVAGIISAIAAAHPKSNPTDPGALERRLADWRNRTFISDGTNFTQTTQSSPLTPATAPSAAAGSAPPTTRPVDLIPSQPPQWVNSELEAVGQSAPLSSALQTLRAAQADAQRELMEKMQNLLLSPGIRLGQAMEKDAAIGRAVERGLDRAEVDRVQYKGDGGVQVRMTLQLWPLWRELDQVTGD